MLAFVYIIAVIVQQIRGWCEEAGGNIELEFEQKEPKVKPTVLDDANVFWVAFKRCMNEL